MVLTIIQRAPLTYTFFKCFIDHLLYWKNCIHPWVSNILGRHSFVNLIKLYESLSVFFQLRSIDLQSLRQWSNKIWKSSVAVSIFPYCIPAIYKQYVKSLRISHLGERKSYGIQIKKVSVVWTLLVLDFCTRSQFLHKWAKKYKVYKCFFFYFNKPTIQNHHLSMNNHRF